MNLFEAMQYASDRTQVIRKRKNLLYTFGHTRLPYVCLSEAEEERNSVVVRQGEVTAERPQIALPGRPHQFEGFDLDEEEGDAMMRVLLARRVEMPPARYVNSEESSRTERGSLESMADRETRRLDDANDIRTAVIAAPDEVWQISVLLYVGEQVYRSAASNVAEHIERIRLQGGGF